MIDRITIYIDDVKFEDRKMYTELNTIYYLQGTAI